MSTPSVQNTSLCASGMPVSAPRRAGGDAFVGGTGRSERTVAVNGDEGVQVGIQGGDAIEKQGREFDAGDLPRIECAAQFQEGSVDHGFGSKVGIAARPAAMRIIR